MTTEQKIRTRELMLRAFDEKKRTADFIASTESIDSYGEIVEQDWLLDRFRSNPVILFAHKAGCLPIGQALRCEVVTGPKGPQLEVTILFAPKDANEEAEKIWQLVRGKFLRAVSVGFRPKSVRVEKRDEKDVYVLSQNELHEISIVTIPANADALAKMVGATERRAEVPPAVDGRGEELAALLDGDDDDDDAIDLGLGASVAPDGTRSYAPAAAPPPVMSMAEIQRTEKEDAAASEELAGMLLADLEASRANRAAGEPDDLADLLVEEGAFE
jgi:HK97 family phage prohead protease